MPNESNILTTVLLSSVVFAALITSLTNLIISLISNRRLKAIERQRNMTEIDKYRYSRLYEMVLNWHNYDSEFEGENPEETAANRLLKGFVDDRNRYDIIRPLLDDHFVIELDKIKGVGNDLLGDFLDIKNVDNFSDIEKKYYENGVLFSNKLQYAINQQLRILLMK